MAVGDSDAETFWAEFLRSLRNRGLGGVRLVVSDAHDGLTKAVRRNLPGGRTPLTSRATRPVVRSLLRLVGTARTGSSLSTSPRRSTGCGLV